MESGATLKGHTLNVLAEVLHTPKEVLTEKERPFHISLIKLINLSSLPFIFIPLATIAVPLGIMYYKKEFTATTKQIVSIQILWFIIAGVLFLLSPFIGKLI